MPVNRKKSKLRQIISSLIRFSITNLDNVIAISLSIIGAVIATFGGQLDYAIAATATSLALLAFSSIKDKAMREKVSTELEKVGNLLEKAQKTITADAFFSKVTNEKEIILRAEEELLIIQETGRLIAETCRQELLSFLRKGGSLRWIAVIDSAEIADLMAFRNANLNSSEMLERMKSGLTMLEVLAREAKEDAKKIEVRFFPYPTDITAVFRDLFHVNPSAREAIIRLQGFQVTYDHKIDFGLNYVNSKSTFDLYMYQAQKIWRASSKCILLTGTPGIGKSTLLCKVVEELRNKGVDNLLGFVTNDIKHGGTRTGFQSCDLNFPNSRAELATKKNGQYTLNEETMNNLLIPILHEGLKAKSRILVIDEIGPIQLQSQIFQDLIQSIINDHQITVFGVVALAGHPFLPRIHQSIRTGIVEVNFQNRNELIEPLVKEFIGKY